MLDQNTKRTGSIRTDLAMESATTVCTDSGLPDGIQVDSFRQDSFEVTDVRITSKEASEKISKPMGRYITLEPDAPLDFTPSDVSSAVEIIAKRLGELLGNPEKVLAVGLGNESITPDSLGPRVCSHIFATRHIRFNAPQLCYDGMKSVSVISAGVMGDTGIEPVEIISPLVDTLKPDAIIVIDALACSQISHLGRTIQLTDTGISPGSGVMNSRKELSRNTLGIPTVAIGIPTIADAGGRNGSLMVTPKNIDKLISSSASLVSGGINRCLHPSLDLEELRLLTS